MQLIKEKKDAQKQQRQAAADIEDALALFAMDMQAENDKILSKIEALHERDKAAILSDDKVKNDTDSPSSHDQEGTHLSEDQQKIMQLANEGYDSTEIAKEMNKGKGEVDLLLKFYR